MLWQRAISTRIARTRHGYPKIIDVVGPSASGKTTLGPLISESLKDLAPSMSVTFEPAGVASSRIGRIQRIIAIARQPGLVRVVLSCLDHRPSELRRQKHAVALYGALSRRAVLLAQAAEMGVDTIVIEQGVIQLAWRYDRESMLRTLPPRLRPSAVVELTEDPDRLLRRRILRGRPSKLRPIQGRERIYAAKRVRNRLARIVGADEANRLVEQWSQDRCDPPLSRAEIEHVTSVPLTMLNPTSGAEPKKDQPGAEDMEVVYGTAWMRISNPDGLSPTSVSEATASALIAILEREHLQQIND